MENKHPYFEEHYLLKYIKGESNERETIYIENWLKKDPENHKILQDMEKVWHVSSSLSDFQNIDLKNDWESVESRINSSSRSTSTKPDNSKSIFPFILRIAASFTLLFGIVYLSLQYFENIPQSITLTTLDNQKSVVLADGSIVHVNEYSELTYPENFIKDKREVYLKGEAFFEVTRNSDKPFIINTDKNASVKVLGTAFNVKVHNLNMEVIVQVVEGKVALYTTDFVDNQMLLEKNETGILSNKSLSKTDGIQENTLSWKTGILIFENTLLTDVINDLVDYYKMSIILDDVDVEKYKITATFDNQPFEEVLEEIMLIVDLEYTIENDTVQFYKPAY